MSVTRPEDPTPPGRRGPALRRALGKLILRVAGWRIVNPAPTAPRCVLVAAPHTSNWDFVFTVATFWAIDVKLHWIGKQSLFRWPFGHALRAMGGVAVDRASAHNMVQILTDRFRTHDRLVLAVPVEGTRRRGEHWKSGFYHIARAAQVPVVLASLDYPRKEATFGPTMELTGELKADMDRIRAFYADKVGRRPEWFGPVRLKGEDAAGPGDP